MEPSCCVEVGGMDGQKGVWWPIRSKEVSRILGFNAPCLASLSLLSLPNIFVCTLTLRMMMLSRDV